MAKRLAIEWDSRELRIVAGTVRGERVTISDVISVPIESSEPQALGETLKRVLAEAGLEKLAAGVALGRGKTEMRELKLPPVPDAELPDMVRFQAIRSFATAGEKSAIDYIATRTDSDGIRVVAASVAPEELKRCALVAVPSQTSVDRLVLRPLAAASLFRNRYPGQEGETILIDMLAEDADIVVLRDGIPVFVRSIRLPEEMKVRVRTLSGEIRRSVMASQDSDTDTNCARRIVLWGRADVHQEEVAALSEALNTSVETLDPFSLVDIESKLKSSMPEHVGRLAPLVGLLDSDARNDKDLIDFLNPRRPPEPPSPVGRYVVIGAAAAALVGTIFFFSWKKISTLDGEIAARQAAYNDLEKGVEDADDTIARTEKVDAFLDGNVIWLEELRRTALQMPPAEQLIVNNLSAEADVRTGGGSLTLEGNVTSGSVIASFEESLRDENHSVIGLGSNVVANKEPYNFTLKETIGVPPTFVRSQRIAAEDAALVASMKEKEPDDEAKPEIAEEASPFDVDEEPTTAESGAEDKGTEDKDAEDKDAEDKQDSDDEIITTSVETKDPTDDESAIDTASDTSVTEETK